LGLGADISWVVGHIFIPSLACIGGGKAIFDWVQKSWQLKVQHQYNKELETLKSEYSKETEFIKAQMSFNQSIMSTVLSQLNVSNQPVNEKRNQAIEVMWKTILDLQDIHSPLDRLDHDFACFGYGDIDRLPRNTRRRLDELDAEDIDKKVNEKIRFVSQYRIFLGEQIWWLFYMYSSFVKQTYWAICLQYGLEEIKGWGEDKTTTNLLKEVLTEDEFRQLNWGSRGAVFRARMMLENKIAHEVNKVFSGEKAAELGLNTAQRYAKVVQESLLASENRPEYKKHLSH
jgi:hypothetical protein